MKKHNLWNRLKIAGKLLLSDKPLVEAYDDGVKTVFNDYKEFRKKLSPMIDKLFDEAWRDSNGVTSSLYPVILNRVRCPRLGDTLGSMIVTDAIAPERDMFPQLEEVRYTSQMIQHVIKLDRRSVENLDLAKRSACAKLAEFLYETDYVKYQMVVPSQSPYGEIVFFINTVQK